MKKIYLFMICCLSFIFSGSMFAAKTVEMNDSKVNYQKVGGGEDMSDSEDRDDVKNKLNNDNDVSDDNDNDDDDEMDNDDTDDKEDSKV